MKKRILIIIAVVLIVVIAMILYNQPATCKLAGEPVALYSMTGDAIGLIYDGETARSLARFGDWRLVTTAEGVSGFVSGWCK